MNVHDAARSYRTAKRDYHSAFQDYFSQQVAALPDDRFWQLQPIFVREVVRFRFGYGRTNGVEQSARELFRKPLADDFSNEDEPPVRCSLEEAIQFAKSWRDLRGRLYGPLFDVVEDRGADAYGDLLDALPLAGRDVIQRALGREYGNQRQLEQAI